jgi:molybdopterin converting factor small subunit
MKIRFKPFATLADHVPESSPNNALELEAATGFAIDLVIEQFRLLGQLVQRAMLNELHINPQDSAKTALDEGDVFEI